MLHYFIFQVFKTIEQKEKIKKSMFNFLINKNFILFK